MQQRHFFSLGVGVCLVFGGLGLCCELAAAQTALPAESEPKIEPERAALDMSAAFERARSLYQDGRFDRCRQAYSELFERLRQTGDGRVSNDTLTAARVYYASCLLAIGEPEQAQEKMRLALARSPLMASPDPVIFPSQVRDLFFTVKAEFLDEVRAAQEKDLREAAKLSQQKAKLADNEQERVRLLEEFVASETVVELNNRWIGAIPFGVGQFQNGDSGLGIVFLGMETIALGSFIFGTAMVLDTHEQAAGSSGIVGSRVRDAEPFNEALTTARVAQVWGFGGLLFSAAIGVLEAQINFVPERALGSRKRLLPEPLRRRKAHGPHLRPTLQTAASSGVTLGLEGQF